MPNIIMEYSNYIPCFDMMNLLKNKASYLYTIKAQNNNKINPRK